MTVRELAESSGSELLIGEGEAHFEGVTIDSRQVEQGYCFVAFKGERVDGNRFCASAIEAGAAVCVLTAAPTQETLEAARASGCALVRAKDDDGEAFMLALAAAWRERNPQWKVIGVTGSVGKTTTKEMLSAACASQCRTHATRGNFNNLLGVPLTLFAADAEDQVLVVEMGMNNAGELSRIARCARPEISIITNVGVSHIGNLGSREAIARAKAEVTEGMEGAQGADPVLVLTATDDYASYITERYCVPRGIKTLPVGTKESALWAEDVRVGTDGCCTLTVRYADGAELTGTLSLPGRAMVFDLLSALGAAEVVGLERKAAFDAICELASSHMRLEVKQEAGTCRVIDDSYNASPASMASSLDVLCSLEATGRKIAVLGEMGELGEEAERLHAMVGAYAAAKGLDLIAFVGGTLADTMAEAASTMGHSEDRMERFSDAHRAAEVLGPILEESDVVLVKASRAVGLDQFVREVLGR